MKKIIICIIAGMLPLLAANAQSTKVPVTSAFEFSGVKLGSEMSAGQIKAKFGRPDQIESEGNEVSYIYGRSEIYTVDNVIESVIIRDAGFPVFGSLISGGIKVGAKAADVKAKLNGLTSCTLREFSTSDGKRGFKAGGADDWISFEVDGRGLVAGIYYHLN